ncbi:MAG: response regulator [Terriglobia bacterium]|jgi:DNA-binding NtrC family response regulator|nr:response regulator [Terriglobia bacterium]
MSVVPITAALPILVIEDEKAVMSYIKIALERHGYKVLSIETGIEALERLKSDRFLGVVSDMRTPGGVDGADVHTWIAKNRPELATRMLFITGDTVNEETAATLRRTGVPYIEKPFRVQQLIAAIEKIMGK